MGFKRYAMSAMMALKRNATGTTFLMAFDSYEIATRSQKFM